MGGSRTGAFFWKWRWRPLDLLIWKDEDEGSFLWQTVLFLKKTSFSGRSCFVRSFPSAHPSACPFSTTGVVFLLTTFELSWTLDEDKCLVGLHPISLKEKRKGVCVRLLCTLSRISGYARHLVFLPPRQVLMRGVSISARSGVLSGAEMYVDSPGQGLQMSSFRKAFHRLFLKKEYLTVASSVYCCPANLMSMVRKTACSSFRTWEVGQEIFPRNQEEWLV